MAPIYAHLLLVGGLIALFIGGSTADLIEGELPEVYKRVGVPPPKDASLAAAIRTTISSNPNTAWFWTGRTGKCANDDDSAMHLAATLASAHGGATLEQRIDSHKVKMPVWGSPDSKVAWAYASSLYAQQASGDVFVVLGKCPRSGNVWETWELPDLEHSGKVNRVYKFEAEGNYKQPQFLWAATGQEAACRQKLKTGKGLYARHETFTA